jgi:hypothetical protein
MIDPKKLNTATLMEKLNVGMYHIYYGPGTMGKIITVNNSLKEALKIHGVFIFELESVVLQLIVDKLDSHLRDVTTCLRRIFEDGKTIKGICITKAI